MFHLVFYLSQLSQSVKLSCAHTVDYTFTRVLALAEKGFISFIHPSNWPLNPIQISHTRLSLCFKEFVHDLDQITDLDSL